LKGLTGIDHDREGEEEEQKGLQESPPLQTTLEMYVRDTSYHVFVK
jgi:hypothetical protein